MVSSDLFCQHRPEFPIILAGQKYYLKEESIQEEGKDLRARGRFQRLGVGAYLECMQETARNGGYSLDFGLNVLEVKGRFQKSQAYPRTLGCFRILKDAWEAWATFWHSRSIAQNSGSLLESWDDSPSFTSWACWL